MPKVELYINGELCDLKGDETIEVDYSIFDIDNIDKRTGARSYEFELPKTNKNKTILENPDIVNNLSQIPYTRMRCVCYVDGVDMLIRFAEITSTKSVYNIRLYGSNTNFYTKIKDKQLSELNLGRFNHTWNIPTMYSSRQNTDGYIYAIIDFHSDSPNSFINDDNKQIDVRYIPPSFYVNTILNQIFTDVGYSLNNEIASDTERMIMPLAFDNPENVSGDISTKYNGKFGILSSYVAGVFGLTDAGSFPFDDIISYSGSFYNPPYLVPNLSSNTFGMYFEDRVQFHLQWKLEVNASASTSLFYNVAVVDENGLSTFVINNIQTIGAGVSNFTIDVDVIMPSDHAYLVIQVGQANDSSVVTITTNTTAEITDAVYVGNMLIYGNYLFINALLPDMTQMQFVKNYLQLFGLVMAVNEISKTVSFTKFNSITNNLGNSIDWSNILDLSEEHEIIFLSDKYGQVNYFKYKQDGDEAIPYGTNSQININNGNLEPEIDLVELDFSSSNMVHRLNNFGSGDNYIPNIPIYKGGRWTSEKSPRLLNLILYSMSDMGGSITYTDGSTSFGFNDYMPMCYFIDNRRTFNLGFGINILANYYNAITDLIQRYKKITLLIRLSASDINQLDFTKPIYLQQFESYFYLSAIKGFSYTESKSTLVELVKLNING